MKSWSHILRSPTIGGGWAGISKVGSSSGFQEGDDNDFPLWSSSGLPSLTPFDDRPLLFVGEFESVVGGADFLFPPHDPPRLIRTLLLDGMLLELGHSALALVRRASGLSPLLNDRSEDCPHGSMPLLPVPPVVTPDAVAAIIGFPLDGFPLGCRSPGEKIEPAGGAGSNVQSSAAERRRISRNRTKIGTFHTKNKDMEVRRWMKLEPKKKKKNLKVLVLLQHKHFQGV